MRRARPSRCRSGSTGRRTPARRSSSSMMSWWIGSASRPHGRGPVRRHVAGLGQLAAGRAPGARPASSRTSSRRGSSSAGSSKSIGGSYPAADAGHDRCADGGTDAGLELRRRVGGRRRAVPDAPAQVQGDRRDLVARVRPAGRRRRPHAARRRASRSRTRSPSTSTTAPSTSSRCSASSRPGWCRSTRTTATPTTSSSTSGTTPTRWRSCSTARFADRIERIRDRVPKVQRWLWVDDGSGPCPDWAVAVRGRPRRPTAAARAPPWGRDGDDLYMLYTGGTTGMPKGVMWRQDDLFVSRRAPRRRRALRERARPRRSCADDGRPSPGTSALPACPLMHGTGWFTRSSILQVGGSRRHARPAARFDIVELLDTDRARARQRRSSIVGDAFAKPILGPRRRARPVGHLQRCG